MEKSEAPSKLKEKWHSRIRLEKESGDRSAFRKRHKRLSENIWTPNAVSTLKLTMSEVSNRAVSDDPAVFLGLVLSGMRYTVVSCISRMNQKQEVGHACKVLGRQALGTRCFTVRLDAGLYLS